MTSAGQATTQFTNHNGIQYISVVDERNRRGRPPKNKKPPELEAKEREAKEQRERELRERDMRIAAEKAALLAAQQSELVAAAVAGTTKEPEVK